jgi:outer membrane lipoprotein-sorting protein
VRRAGALAGLGALLLLGGAQPSGEAARLAQAVRGLRSIRADFVQIRDVSLTGESIQAHGVLAFRPPDRFRLAYVTPEPQELVIRGDSLWVIVPSENQAQRYPYADDAPGSEVFLLFGGRGRALTDVFDVKEGPWGSYPRALRLVPKNVEPGYPIEEIRVVLGPGGLPQRLFLREATGDNVVFTFRRVEKNVADIDSLVRLRIPPGMEVIETTPTRQAGDLPIDR